MSDSIPETESDPGRTPRKLDGTRVLLPKDFVAYLDKKQRAFKKRTGKDITVAVMIVSSFSEEQCGAYLKEEEAKLKPWLKKKGANDGAAI
jgi:hypothetical protein